MTSPFLEDEVHVREHPLPGNARMFCMNLADGSTVTLRISSDSSDRALEVTPPGADESVVAVHFNPPESTILAALLSGVRFVFDQGERELPADAAHLRTVTLPPESMAIGRRVGDLGIPDDADATVVAVIRDDTDDLIETDPDRACQPGDRLVLVGHTDSLAGLVKLLTG